MSVVINGTTGITFPSAAVQADTALGYGQTWQNVTASRASNTNYTNSTGRPIFVYIVETTSANGSFYIDNVIYGSGISSTASSRGSIIFIVPAGSTYKWDAGINTWSELR